MTNCVELLAKKLMHWQLVKYDIDQKILDELVNATSREILFTIKKHAKRVDEISYDTKLPVSTLYKKLIELEQLGLIFVERIEISDNGRKSKYYRSRISEAEIIFKKLKPQIILVPNKNLK